MKQRTLTHRDGSGEDQRDDSTARHRCRAGKEQALPCLLLAAAAWLVTLGGGPAVAGESVYETAHYRIRFSGSTQDATEFTQVLEAAWAPLEEYFGAAPTLEDGQLLDVHVFDTADEWLASVTSSNVHTSKSKLTADDAGCYSPETRTASLYRQPTRYDTRVLLLHECIHQFHFLARRTPGLPPPVWYGEGVAEHLSLHTWDGESLQLGVQPVLSLREYPRRAREELAQPLPSWGPMLAGRAPVSRPIAWALVRHLESQGDDAVRLGFRRFGAAMDSGGGMPLRTLVQETGRDAPTPDELVRWLRDVRQPWVPATNGWEDAGGGTLRGRSPGLALCRLREPATRLEAEVRVPDADGRVRGGMLLHWSGPEDFTTALIRSSGTLRVEHRKDGRWWPRFTTKLGDVTEAGELTLAAERTAEGVTLTVNDETFGPWELPGSTLGLVVDGSDLRFHDLTWTPVAEAAPAPELLPAVEPDTAAQTVDSTR